MKAKSLIAVLGKRFGVRPPGYDEVAPTWPTLGDVDSAEALADVPGRQARPQGRDAGRREALNGKLRPPRPRMYRSLYTQRTEPNDMDNEVRRALTKGGVIDMTTTGRRTGQPRRIEIVYHRSTAASTSPGCRAPIGPAPGC